MDRKLSAQKEDAAHAALPGETAVVVRHPAPGWGIPHRSVAIPHVRDLHRLRRPRVEGKRHDLLLRSGAKSEHRAHEQKQLGSRLEVTTRVPFRKATGHRKRTRHHRDPGHIHELTSSCDQRWSLLTNDVWGRILAESTDRAIEDRRYRLSGFVFMPEHVHLMIYPLAEADAMDAC